MTRAAWVVDRQAVSSAVIDGELVVMNLATGHYFSSLGTGITVWNCLEQGSDHSAIVDAVAKAHEAPLDTIEADLDAFIQTLRSHGLVQPWEGQPEPSGGERSRPSVPRAPYEPPKLLVYSDMRDLLLLDPVHEVSDAGWPVRASDSASSVAGETGP